MVYHRYRQRALNFFSEVFLCLKKLKLNLCEVLEGEVILTSN
jgi:hypothetical protein